MLTSYRLTALKLRAIALFCILGLSACATTTETHRTHASIRHVQTLENAGTYTQAPVRAKIYELTASGTLEERPDWSAQATESILAAANDKLGQHMKSDALAWPDLTEQEQALVSQHIALYTALANAQNIKGASAEWRKRFEKQDMSVGSGLSFLREKTNADWLIITTGAQAKSTGGRMAVMLLAAAAGVAIPTGQAHIEVAVLELKTGNVLWRNAAISTTSHLTDRNGASTMMDAALRGFEELTNKIPEKGTLGPQ